MNRLYVAESAYSTTGLMADHRRRMTAADVAELAVELAVALGLRGGDAPGELATRLAEELRSAGSRSIVLAGETQPAEVHALCAVINHALGRLEMRLSFWIRAQPQPQG